MLSKTLSSTLTRQLRGALGSCVVSVAAGGSELPAPTGSIYSNTDASLDWSFDSVADFTGYEIQTSPNGSTEWSNVFSESTAALTGSIFQPPGTSPYYRARWMYAGDVYSAWSAPVQVSISTLTAPGLNGPDFPTADPGEGGCAWSWDGTSYILAMSFSTWAYEGQGILRDVGYWSDEGLQSGWVSLGTYSFESNSYALANYTTQINLRVRACSADLTTYYGEPSPPVTTVVPHVPPTDFAGAATESNLSFSWTRSTSGDGVASQYLLIVNTSTATTMFANTLGSGESGIEQPPDVSPTVGDSWSAAMRVLSSNSGSYDVPPSAYIFAMGTVS